MAEFEIPSGQREFRCNYCDGKILIPKELPPTTGPCPHCTAVITSPPLEVPVAEFKIPVPPPPQVRPMLEPVVQTPPPAPKIAEIPVTVDTPKAVPEATVPEPTPAPSPPPIPEKKSISAPVPEPLATIAQGVAENPKPDLTKPLKSSKPEKIIAPKRPKSHSSGIISTMLIILALGIAGGGIVYYASQERGNSIPPPEVKVTAGDPAIAEANYIRVGWQKDAYQLLKDYLAGTTVADKLPFILNGDQLAPRIETFFGGGVINDADTPVDGFSIYELSEEDRKRGLFMMTYDQPPQFDMKEFFRPLATLEVQNGIDEADLLLSTLARVGNFDMEPLRVHAFFKRTPAGLKLDWEIFAQTKYRTFQNFVEIPEIGQSAVFRVFIVEDVPEKGRAVTGARTYRLVDPANTTDTARINVKIDSETGRALSLINWRGTKENQPITKTATVELKWIGEPDSPELSIDKFICWEFLGLGGQETPATASNQ